LYRDGDISFLVRKCAGRSSDIGCKEERGLILPTKGITLELRQSNAFCATGAGSVFLFIPELVAKKSRPTRGLSFDHGC
jgi:hypothetical protein